MNTRNSCNSSFPEAMGNESPDLCFAPAFEALTGHKPFPWQSALYEWFLQEGVPRLCDIPTGLGKTAVIPIWLIALANSAVLADSRVNIPRRLVYIVNRRTVVDQATAVVEQVRTRLQRPHGPGWSQHTQTLQQIAARLRCLAASDDVPLAVSTLRGELADNQQWQANPARPAVIVGTVDMIGSKLLFSGYGDGFKMRAHYAGLIGHDALFVHDEAHLTPAFGELLKALAKAQHECREPRPIRVMELSATPGQGGGGAFTLTPEDNDHPIVRGRLNAPKRLVLDRSDKKDLARRLAELALSHEANPAKVLIYVQQPEVAGRVADALRNGLGNSSTQRVALLTGTIRGYERDRLVKENLVFQALLDPASPAKQSVYLVSTSAGEVGIDLDADHMVCDLTTLDSLVQRLGRVNRRGGREARIDLVIQPDGETTKKKASAIDGALACTLSMLQQLPKLDQTSYDASPRALRNLLAGMSDDEKRRAFAPCPPVVPLTDILLDAWSLTTIREPLPGRPEVAPYLHGLTADPPDTYVVWRAEVRLLDEANASPETLRRWFQACRIEARERLRDRTGRVFEELQRLAEQHGHSRTPIIVLNERGDARLSSLSHLLEDGEDALEYHTLVLPVEAGGLTDVGMLDGNSTQANDVADTFQERERWIATESEAENRLEPLIPDPAPPGDPRSRKLVVACRLPLRRPPEDEEEDKESRYLELWIAPKRAGTESEDTGADAQPPSLGEHTQHVVAAITSIVQSLNLDPQIQEALILAAGWHDRGKDRAIWQRAISNPAYVAGQHAGVLAKPAPDGMNWRLLGGYRHEFGSLLEAEHDPEIQNHPQKDLILHLIAAHHGRARPHFEPEAFDIERFTTEQNEAAAHEVMRRFGRLQQRFGRWGLAWLESLLRCADALASEAQAGRRYKGDN